MGDKGGQDPQEGEGRQDPREGGHTIQQREARVQWETKGDPAKGNKKGYNGRQDPP